MADKTGLRAYLAQMTEIFPPAPAVGTPMLPARPSPEACGFLSLRRSANKAMLTSPGPTGEALNEILATAMRVPDHRRMSPWRFIIFEGDARARFGQAAAEVQRSEDPSAKPEALEATKTLLMRAPTVVAVVSSPTDDGKTPVWEQELSTGAVTYNLLLAANAAGWAGVWLTEWLAFSEGINKLLGLEDNERLAGYIYLGTATADPQERARPDAAPLISHWSG
ncbi:nitroreductase [Henriciella sp. AS95]|uniref:nitroreductase family protein n=1 Tax=Henriciella sp. AS95 TaxID=3135782 RepID=UPI00316CD11F